MNKSGKTILLVTGGALLVGGVVAFFLRDKSGGSDVQSFGDVWSKYRGTDIPSTDNQWTR